VVWTVGLPTLEARLKSFAIRGYMIEDREKAMIYIINFFNSRMSAMSNANRNKVKELIGIHEIALQELVNKYLELVHENS
jgi:hypothetical protein